MGGLQQFKVAWTSNMIMQTRLFGCSLICFSLLAGTAHSQIQSLGIRVFSRYYDIKGNSFGIEAIAPPDTIRELVVCKAVKMAETKHAEKVSMGNPSYGQVRQTSGDPFTIKVPDGWAVLHATAYLGGQNPDGNPYLDVAERAAMCRKMWDWYH